MRPVSELNFDKNSRDGSHANIRHSLRELQWILPLSIQKALFRAVARGYNPYTDWNKRFQAIFIHVPRTAGTSIASATKASKPHIPISRFIAFEPKLHNRLFKFAFVRNPWDRLLSSFSHMRAKAANDPEWLATHATLAQFPDFESFVMALEHQGFRRRILSFIHFRRQIDWLTLPYSKKIEVDFVGRFETLVEDYAHY